MMNKIIQHKEMYLTYVGVNPTNGLPTNQQLTHEAVIEYRPAVSDAERDADLFYFWFCFIEGQQEAVFLRKKE